MVQADGPKPEKGTQGIYTRPHGSSVHPHPPTRVSKCKQSHCRLLERDADRPGIQFGLSRRPRTRGYSPRKLRTVRRAFYQNPFPPPLFFSFFLIFQTITPSLPAYHILSYILTRITLSSSDHVNDYCSLDKHADGKPALWMCYAGGSGFGGYGGYGGYHRRVRFFDIDTNEAHITTYKRVEWGETEKRIDEQTVVDGGRVVES